MSTVLTTLLKKSFIFSKNNTDWRRIFFICLGIVLFCIVYFLPQLPNAVDPMGKSFILTHEGKTALALFLLAACWWIFEVVPIGVTSITIGVIQAVFLIRNARVAFSDFMDPAVWFILGSIVIGMAFTQSGLTKRLAYRMLLIVGERTIFIYLGCFILTAVLTLIMAHTAVAATVYPLLIAIYSLYSEDEKPTNFGKGLFIGMAFVAGAGSIITLLGAARGAVAIGFFNDIVGREITFFELSFYMAPFGFIMVLLLWIYISLRFSPEKKKIEGLRDRARSLHKNLGPMRSREVLTLLIVISTITLMCLRSFYPELKLIDKSAIILTSTILFYLLKLLSLDQLEEIPWNIILLFGGAMSIGYCLWQTGAADWLAVNWLVMFKETYWYIFVIGIAFFVMIMTNLIMNVAAITIVLPVALVMGSYLGVAPEIIVFASLATAGMPFLFLIGAAPNAIAYSSRQFTAGEFFVAGIPASAILMIILGLFVCFIWPFMGMPC
jgi:sodium-dependent dicarboxylate transporter 2/3/5